MPQRGRAPRRPHPPGGGLRCSGVAAYYRGEVSLAQAHFAQGRGYSRGQQPHTHMAHYGQDPEAICLTYGALTCWLCGTPDQALALMHQALAHAHAMAHPFGVGTVLSSLRSSISCEATSRPCRCTPRPPSRWRVRTG